MREQHSAMTLNELADFWAGEKPDDIAYRFEDRATSFADFRDESETLARAFAAEGIGKGDRIAWIGKNSDRYFLTLFAAARLGAVTVPVGWRLATAEMAFIVEDAEAGTIVAGPEFIDLAGRFSEEIACVERLFSAERSATAECVANLQVQHGNAPPADHRPHCDDPIVQLYTSGTTGQPKGVVLTQNNLLKGRSRGQREIPNWDQWSEGDAGLQAMPVAHIAGTGYGIVPFNRGMACSIIAEFDIGKTLDLIDARHVTRFFLVPAALQMLITHPRGTEIDTSAVVQIAYGASPMPLQLLRDCMNAFPNAGFAQFYGMTETTGTIVVLPPEDHHPEGNERMRSAGKPLDGVEVRIVDEHGEEVGVGEVGEIVTRSEANMVHYWKQPERTAETVDGDGWLRTGDAAYRDADGYIYIHDRMKDMIITGGENVYPAEVENALYEHPHVSEAAVIGVPDETWGEAVKAVIVPKNGAKIDEQEIITFIRERIAGYKTPKSVDVIAVMPRNASGKVLKKDLRAPYWEGRERQVN
jgi:acyl-CoA synthetase (AMP-forming)/AMP-acid ligase II